MNPSEREMTLPESSKPHHKAKPLTACDVCRKRKIKCEFKTQSLNCISCVKRNRECSFNFIKDRNATFSSIPSPHHTTNPVELPSNSIDSTSGNFGTRNSELIETLSQKNDTNLYSRTIDSYHNGPRGLRSLPPLQSVISQTRFLEPIEELRQLLQARQTEWNLDFHAVALVPTFFQRFNGTDIIHFDSFMKLLTQPQLPVILVFLVHTMASHVLIDQPEPLLYHTKAAYNSLATLPLDYQLLMSGLSILNRKQVHSNPYQPSYTSSTSSNIRLPRIEWSPHDFSNLPTDKNHTKSHPSDHAFR